jgi:hypothetical protein
MCENSYLPSEEATSTRSRSHQDCLTTTLKSPWVRMTVIVATDIDIFRGHMSNIPVRRKRQAFTCRISSSGRKARRKRGCRSSALRLPKTAPQVYRPSSENRTGVPSTKHRKVRMTRHGLTTVYSRGGSSLTWRCTDPGVRTGLVKGSATWPDLLGSGPHWSSLVGSCRPSTAHRRPRGAERDYVISSV